MAIDTVKKPYKDQIDPEQDEELGDLEVMLFMQWMKYLKVWEERKS
jgi:hypothetical protein